jgi:multidrug resistance efflux pump
MRTFVILGIALLIVSVVGAKLALDQRNPTHAKSNGTDKPIENVVCWGYFEIRGGVAQLDAKQSGDILFVEEENKPVKAGAVLLRVNDRLGDLKAQQAEQAVANAELQLKDAKKLKPLYKIQEEMQNLAIEAAQADIAELNSKEKRDLDLIGKADPKYKAVQDLYAEGRKKLELKKKGEEAKLKQIKLQSADDKIAQAEADLQAKKLQREEAKEMLTHFQIVAPSDGTILRSNVKKGEILVPNPLRHALEFLPKGDIIVRAEVLQEWGRFIKKGQAVEIEDDTFHGPTWKGEVEDISKWYAPIRSPVIEPFRYNDVRTLEIVLRVTGADDVKIGQRVRAKVNIK